MALHSETRINLIEAEAEVLHGEVLMRRCSHSTFDDSDVGDRKFLVLEMEIASSRQHAGCAQSCDTARCTTGANLTPRTYLPQWSCWLPAKTVIRQLIMDDDTSCHWVRYAVEWHDAVAEARQQSAVVDCGRLRVEDRRLDSQLDGFPTLNACLRRV